MVMPLFVGWAKSIRSLDEALESGRQLLLGVQQQVDLKNRQLMMCMMVGTIANYHSIIKIADGNVKVLVEGQQRANILSLQDTGEFFSAEVLPIDSLSGDEKELDVVRNAVLSEFEKYANLKQKSAAGYFAGVATHWWCRTFSDTLAAHFVGICAKQILLKKLTWWSRFEYLLGLMETEADLLQIEKAYSRSWNKWRKLLLWLLFEWAN